MNKSRCPHCGVTLGNYRYADACPSCRVELEHNTKPLITAPVRAPHKSTAWLIRLFRGAVRFVES